MRITLDRALFAQPTDDETLLLTRLLLDVVDTELQPPLVLLDPPYLQEDVDSTVDGWLLERGAAEARAFRSLFAASLLISPTRPLHGSISDGERPQRWHLAGELAVRIARRAQSDWAGRTLTLRDAWELLREPVNLILENPRTEPAFLRALLGPTEGALLGQLLASPSRVKVMAGGGEGKKWLETFCREPLDAPGWRRLLRTFVLLDRDSGDHDARQPSATAVKLYTLCSDLVIQRGDVFSYVCLLRREVESYTPDEGLRLVASLPQQRSFIEQVIQWRATGAARAGQAAIPTGPDPVWAWSLDLKMGLRGDILDTVPYKKALKDRDKNKGTPLLAVHLKLPFSTLAQGDIDLLDHPLRDRIGDVLRDPQARPDWLADVPAEYDRGPMEQAPRVELVRALFARM